MERDLILEAFVAACQMRADEETVPPRGIRWEVWRDDYYPTDAEIAACPTNDAMERLLDRCADRAVRAYVEDRAERLLAKRPRPECNHSVCWEISTYCIEEEGQ